MIIILTATSLELECKFLLVILLWLILQRMFAWFYEPLVKGQRLVNTITLISTTDDCILIYCHHHRGFLLNLRLLYFMAMYLRSFPYFKWTNFLPLDTLSQFIRTIFMWSEMDVLLLREFVFFVVNKCLTISDSNWSVDFIFKPCLSQAMVFFIIHFIYWFPVGIHSTTLGDICSLTKRSCFLISSNIQYLELWGVISTVISRSLLFALSFILMPTWCNSANLLLRFDRLKSGFFL